MKHWKLRISPYASDDVVQIIEYLAETVGFDIAITVDAKLEKAIASLEKFAERGRVVPELRQRGISQFRELMVAPYRIVYRIHDDEVWLVMVFDHRREPMSLLATRLRNS